MKFDPERASRIVAEVALYGLKEAARRNATHIQTVRNYVAREASDEAFRERCAKNREVLGARLERERSEWGDASVTCLRACLGTIEAAALHLRKQIELGKLEPNAVRSLAGAVKIVAEANITRRTLFGDGAEKTDAPPETNPVH
jgi:hypothetical protein